MKPEDLVNKMLGESESIAGLPTVEELFHKFKQVNIDCLQSGESVVDFTDTDFYANQIQAIYGDEMSPTDEEADMVAAQLRDYAKAQGYRLPGNAEGTLRYTKGPFTTQADAARHLEASEVIFQADPDKFYLAVPV